MVLYVCCTLMTRNSFQLVQFTGKSAAVRQSNVLARNTDIRTISVLQYWQSQMFRVRKEQDLFYGKFGYEVFAVVGCYAA
jgi:hypothetical protein